MLKEEQNRRFQLGILYTCLGSLGISLYSIATKMLLQHISNITLLALVSFVIPSLFVVPYLIFAHGILEKLRKITTLKLQILRVLFVLSNQYAYFIYLDHAPLINAVVFINTAPLFIPVVSYFALKQKSGRSTWIGVILGVLGVLCITQPEQGFNNPYVLVGLLSGILLACSQVTWGVLMQNEDWDVTIFCFFFFTSILGTIVFLSFSLWQENLIPSLVSLFATHSSSYILMAIIGIGMILNQLVRGQAYRYASPSSLTPFMYLSVVFTGIFDWLYYNHIPDFIFLMGVVLIIFGSLLKLLYIPKV